MNQMTMPTTVVDSWPYYEFERYVMLLNEKNENEKKKHEEQEKEQKSNTPNMGNMGNIAKNFTNFKPPSFKNPF